MFPYWSIDLDQSDVGFLIHVFDLGVERGSALQLHLEEMKSLVPFTLTSSTTRHWDSSHMLNVEQEFSVLQFMSSTVYSEYLSPALTAVRCSANLYSVLVGDHVGVGDDESVLWHDKPRAAGDGHLTLRKYHPEQKEKETCFCL